MSEKYDNDSGNLDNILLIDEDEEQETGKKSGSKKLFLVVAMALILLSVVVFTIYALTRSEQPPQASTTSQPSLAPPITPPTTGGGFTDVNMNTVQGGSSSGSSALEQQDKFEDIIAKIKSEQNKTPDIPARPNVNTGLSSGNANTQNSQGGATAGRVPSTPPTTVVAPPPGATTTATSNEDIRDLFKPQSPAEPVVVENKPKPEKPAPQKPQSSIPPRTVSVQSDPNGIFFIQTASVSKFSDDSDFAKKIRNHKLPYRIQEENVNDKTVYRVLIGPYGSRADALKVLETVRYYLQKDAFIKQIQFND